MSAVAVHAGIGPEVTVQRHGRVEPGLPRRLRVAPEYARRAGAGDVRPSQLQPTRAGPAVADRRDDFAGVEDGRPHLIEEEIGDAIADAVLGLTAAADGEEGSAAHVVDAVPVAGELGPDLPSDARALEQTHVGRQLVTPAAHLADVDDLKAGEPGFQVINKIGRAHV